MNHAIDDTMIVEETYLTTVLIYHLQCTSSLVHCLCMKHGKQIRVTPFSFRLDSHSGVPVYRQLIDQVQAAVATGVLRAGDQLPTIRLVAVELAINPNTVTRAYREMEIRGLVDSQQGMGTFVAERQIESSRKEQNRQLAQLIAELISRAGAAGFTVSDLMEALHQISSESQQRR